MKAVPSDTRREWQNGRCGELYQFFGAQPHAHSSDSWFCRTWAPSARSVHVVGDFNHWRPDGIPLCNTGEGVWEGEAPHLKPGSLYKYAILGPDGQTTFKADPFARMHESAPNTASIVHHSSHLWHDSQWMQSRAQRQHRSAPLSLYEIHLGSWMLDNPYGERHQNYREVAVPLADYITKMGFTHVEFMPLTEFPYGPSWGYQVTGYFSPTSRFGTPDDFKFLVDTLHQAGIGVILDWVPAHFPFDEHGLARFDGTALYEHPSPQRGYHPDWHTAIFDYGRPEVRSFLLSSAHLWLDLFHIDGLRVDAVASMLYLDYSRNDGEWSPNVEGGHHNLEAISFLQTLNQSIHDRFPGVLTMAEESTAFAGVTRSQEQGGLGFDYKWDMGWMHDTLEYFQRDPIYRRHHQHELTFRMVYAYTESFTLPLSHDEVVHGKQSLLAKMPGDPWQQHANLRLLLANMFAAPGKKLLFMGSELAMLNEWDHDSPLPWQNATEQKGKELSNLVSALNFLYRKEPALHSTDTDQNGFNWIDTEDHDQSVLSFARYSQDGNHAVLAVFNHTPVIREHYRVGLPESGRWAPLFNTNAQAFGGTDTHGGVPIQSESHPWHGQHQSARLTLPPLAAIFFKWTRSI